MNKYLRGRRHNAKGGPRPPMVKYNGVTKNLSDWAIEIGVSHHALRERVRKAEQGGIPWDYAMRKGKLCKQTNPDSPLPLDYADQVREMIMSQKGEFTKPMIQEQAEKLFKCDVRTSWIFRDLIYNDRITKVSSEGGFYRNCAVYMVTELLPSEETQIEKCTNSFLYGKL